MDKDKCYFDSLRKVLNAVTSTLSLEEVLSLLVGNVTEALELKACAIRLFDPAKRTLELVASHGLSQKYLQKGPVDADRSVADSMKGQIVTIYQIDGDPRTQYPKEATEEGLVSMAAIPLSLQDKVIGVMRIYTGVPRMFTEQELEFAEALGEMGAVAIQNARLHEGLKKAFDRTATLYAAEMNS